MVEVLILLAILLLLYLADTYDKLGFLLAILVIAGSGLIYYLVFFR